MDKADYKTTQEEREYQSAYYFKNKEQVVSYQKKYRKANRERINKRNKKFKNDRKIEAIKRLGGICNKCKKEYEPCVFDFHHVNRKEKEFLISKILSFSEERFWNEVDKCILLCANCHRIEHANE